MNTAGCDPDPLGAAPEPSVTAVLPVYVGVRPDHLREAVRGLMSQTRAVDEIVLVRDGPLLAAQDEVLSALRDHPNVIEIQLQVNQGAGVANQAGLAAATGEWIAKFDSDDICLPTRIERQLAAVAESHVDVCGTAMLEFDENPSRPVALRSGPLEHDEIARRMAFNNPINHPTCLFRRDLALSAGGYADLRYMQDYDLFARMLVSGARMANLPDALVLFRADDAMRRRRGAGELLRLEWRLQARLRSYGLVTRPRSMANLVARASFRLLPAPAMRLVYRRILSRPVSADWSEV